MVFGPFIDGWNWVKPYNPVLLFKKRHFSFITIHYMYLIGLSIVMSVMIYPAGRVAYIDALFLATGSATQSGLNTIDINQLHTYQQVVLYFGSMVANPIFINTFVVFVRLYWFEKRFMHIVQEARNFRKAKSRSRTNTQALDEKDIGQEERGINGRSIVVLHDQKRENGFIDHASPPLKFNLGSPRPDASTDSESAGRDSSSREDQPERRTADFQETTKPPFHRDITFADERASPATPATPVPQQMNAEQHIAFLENQRNPKDKGILRIPGPRDYDQGKIPERLKEDEEGNAEMLHEEVRSPLENPSLANGENAKMDELSEETSDDLPVKRNITIDESNHPPRSELKRSTFSKLTLRNLGKSPSKAASTTFDGASVVDRPKRSGTFGSFLSSASKEKEPMPYLSWQPTIGRNSAFIDLTEEQREELGGIEYRSLKSLAVILVLYFACFHLFGVVTMLPWIVCTSTWGSIVEADAQSKVWWGIFTPASMLNDLGFTLTPDSMISFQEAVLPLLIGSFLIVIGNTGFPCMLRFIIWLIHKMIPSESGLWEELKFLLDHPRRCFTLLFPSAATWWLFWILVVLNGLDIIFFIVLDLNDSAITSINPAGYRLLDGLFQATSTRTAGLAVVNLSLLHPAIQVSYLIMMYISVFPIALSVRRTNVYEEKSLGIWANQTEEAEDSQEPSYVGAHLRRQLSFDLWFIFMGLFIVAIAEGSRLQDPTDVAFSMFSCLFEIVSAYGTVGLSLGYPTINASFSAEFSVVSKLVIIAMQVRGRHRGLPYELDRAILLPSESLHRKEDQDAAKRISRRPSNISMMSNAAGAGGLFSPTSFGVSTGRENGSIDTRLEPTKSNHTRGGLGKMMAGIAARTPDLSPKGEKPAELRE